MVDFVNKIMALGTVAGQVMIVLGLVYLIFFRKKQFAIITIVKEDAVLFAFLISLVSVLGSLFYSEIAGFPPCDLCWVQRIFMYPLVIVLGFALANKDNRLITYAIASSVIGA